MSLVHSANARALLASVSLVALTAFAIPASAANTTAAASADQSGSGGIETVTVTATRTAKDAQTVGVSLTALTADDLKIQAPHTLQDLNGSAPNVFIGLGTAGPAQSAIFIRGQGYADVEKTQSPPVGVIQDGVFFGNNTGQLLDLFDVCSVEVDRGPQGIFYGKNTTAGLINITRCAPTRQWGATVSAGYGSYNDAFVRGVFNAPLGENGGVKVTAQYHTNSGYYRDIFTNKQAGGDQFFAVNGVVDYDVTTWLNANFSIDHTHDSGGGVPVQYGNVLTANILGVTGLPGYNPITGSPDGLKPRQVENRPGGDSDKYDNDIYSLILKAQTPIGQLISQTAFMDEADTVDQDFDGTCKPTPAPACNSYGNFLLGGAALETIRAQKYQQFTQEFRLNGTIWDQVDYLAGVFFYHHDIYLHQNTDAVVDQFSTEGDVSWSVFGNLDWNVTDTIKLSAGVRNIDESKHFSTAYFVGGVVPITPHILAAKTWNDTITRFNAQWQYLPDNLVYVNRSEGFRSGGFSIRGTLSEQSGTQSNCGVPAGCPGNNFLAYNPETNVTYEIGSKNQFFNHTLTFNVDGFINEISNFQQSEVIVTPGYGPGTNTYIVNYPKVDIKGIELQLDAAVGQWLPVLDGLTLTSNVGIQGARVKNGVVNGQQVGIGAGATAGAPGTTADFTGSPLQRVPSNNFTIRGTYEHDFGADNALTLSMGYSWIAKFSLGTFGVAQDIQPGYGLLDASATYDYQNYYIKLSGRNLTDVDYRDQSLPTVFFQGWGPPRTVQVEVGAKF